MSGANTCNSSIKRGERPINFGHDSLNAATGTGFQAARSASANSSHKPNTFTHHALLLLQLDQAQHGIKQPAGFPRDWFPVSVPNLIIYKNRDAET